MKSVLIVFLGVIAVSWGYPAAAGVSDIANLDEIRVLEGEDSAAVVHDEVDREPLRVIEINLTLPPKLIPITVEPMKTKNEPSFLSRLGRSIESDSDSDCSSEDSSDEDWNSSGKAKNRTDKRRRKMEENDSFSPSDDSDSSDSSESTESTANHDIDQNPTTDGNAIVLMQLNNESGTTGAPQIDRRSKGSESEIRRKRMAWNVMRSSKESEEGERSAPRMRWMWDDKKSEVELPNRNTQDITDPMYEQGIEEEAYPRIPFLNIIREPCKSKFERRDRHGICRPSFMM